VGVASLATQLSAYLQIKSSTSNCATEGNRGFLQEAWPVVWVHLSQKSSLLCLLFFLQPDCELAEATFCISAARGPSCILLAVRCERRTRQIAYISRSCNHQLAAVSAGKQVSRRVNFDCTQSKVMSTRALCCSLPGCASSSSSNSWLQLQQRQQEWVISLPALCFAAYVLWVCTCD
jgi:hypothetical protein